MLWNRRLTLCCPFNKTEQPRTPDFYSKIDSLIFWSKDLSAYGERLSCWKLEHVLYLETKRSFKLLWIKLYFGNDPNIFLCNCHIFFQSKRSCLVSFSLCSLWVVLVYFSTIEKVVIIFSGWESVWRARITPTMPENLNPVPAAPSTNPRG